MSIFDRFRNQPAPQPSDDPAPKGRSGRGHAAGFIELEELNSDLRHPQSHRVYDEMYRGDGDIRQVIQMSCNPIIGGTWRVDPYGGKEATDRDREVADDLWWAVTSFMSPSLIGHLAQFLPVLLRSGFVPGETVWGRTEREDRTLLAPASIGLRMPRSIWRWFQDGDTLVGIQQFLPAGGATVFNEGVSVYGGSGSNSDGSGIGMVRYARKDIVYYRVGAEGDNWEGVSLLRPAYKHWYLKDRIERIDAVAQEREALGIPVVYPPTSASEKQLDDIEEILKDLRTNEQGYIVMPGMKAGAGAPDGTGWLFELMGFDRSGSGRDPHPSLDYHTAKIAAAFIAEFMRLGHGGSGSRATATAQKDPFEASIEALATIIEEELHESITLPFCAYNYSDVKNPPRLKMSLVDQTSVTELADFVMKLVQVGALLPDKELEEALRARADLPAMDPDAVKARGDDDAMTRAEIVGGNINPTPKDEAAAKAALEQAKVAPALGGAAGGGGKPGAGKPAAKSAKKTGAPKGPGGAGKGAPRGPAKSLDALAMAERFPYARDWELHVDLDAMAETFDGMGPQFAADLGHHVRAIAAGDATSLEALRTDAHGKLMDAYLAGVDHIWDELARQGWNAGTIIASEDRGARDRSGALDERADAVVARVALAVSDAMLGHDLAHGQQGRAQAAGERAGLRALEQGGRRHGVAALIHGRHDQAHTLAALDDGPTLLARYTSILDDHRCHECNMADDGVARELDDPVRREHMPPNPHCESLGSGDNLCRCFEVYEFAPDATGG